MNTDFLKVKKIESLIDTQTNRVGPEGLLRMAEAGKSEAAIRKAERGEEVIVSEGFTVVFQCDKEHEAEARNLQNSDPFPFTIHGLLFHFCVVWVYNSIGNLITVIARSVGGVIPQAA